MWQALSTSTRGATCIIILRSHLLQIILMMLCFISPSLIIIIYDRNIAAEKQFLLTLVVRYLTCVVVKVVNGQVIIIFIVSK